MLPVQHLLYLIAILENCVTGLDIAGLRVGAAWIYVNTFCLPLNCVSYSLWRLFAEQEFGSVGVAKPVHLTRPIPWGVSLNCIESSSIEFPHPFFFVRCRVLIFIKSLMSGGVIFSEFNREASLFNAIICPVLNFAAKLEFEVVAI